MTEHTDLPWKYRSAATFEGFTIANSNDSTIAKLYVFSDNTEANAEFIVKACNCHYDLLTALDDCIEALAFLEKRTSTKTNPPTLEKARAVAAKARSNDRLPNQDQQ